MIPIIPPVKRGNKNLKFSFIFLKNPKIEFIKFSQMPKITHKTPLLIPGRIAPAPNNIPFKKIYK